MTHQSDRTLNKFLIAATVGLVLTVAATTSVVAWPRISDALGIKPTPPPAQPPAYVTGQQIDVPASWYARSPRTLILFARESCSACQKAQPFLKALVTSLEGRASVVMAHPRGSEESDALYARSLGLPESQLRVVTANLRVKATPTLVLVNEHGAVLAAWEGVGKEDRQGQISATIAKFTSVTSR